MAIFLQTPSSVVSHVDPQIRFILKTGPGPDSPRTVIKRLGGEFLFFPGKRTHFPEFTDFAQLLTTSPALLERTSLLVF